MKQRGFISSALLYGMLALFLVIMLSTLAVLGNRKLSMDKLKENALKNVQTGYVKPEALFVAYDGLQVPDGNLWTDQTGNNNPALLVGPTFDKDHLVFTGDDYIIAGLSQADLKTKFTITMVVDITSTAGGLWGLDSGFSAKYTGGLMKICQKNTSNAETCLDTPLPQYTGGKKQITAVYQSTVGITVYVNGIQFTDYQGITTAIKPDGNLIIGKSSAASFLSGNLYSFVAYDDILSEDEVLANYEVDREKYGL